MDDRLRLDLETVVARLDQVAAEGGWETALDVVKERILTCDLPRLQEHLDGLAAAGAEAEGEACPESELDTGYGLMCELPKGHLGLHEASITWA